MNAFSNDKILRATALTRSGRLREALDVLRGALDTTPGVDRAAPSLLDKLGAFARRAAGAPAPHTVPGAGSRFEARRYEGAHGHRDYKIFVPSSYRGQAMPLVVMLHGCSQNPDDFAAGTRMNEVAEERGFLVVYPAQSQAANLNKCWNWFNPADQHRGAGEPAIVAGIVAAVGEEFAVKDGAVFAAGLSAGGALAATLGAAYPELFAAIGVHSGLACGAASDMGSAFVAMRQGGVAKSVDGKLVPAIVFHGDKDRTVNLANADEVIRQAAGGEALRDVVMDGDGFTRTVRMSGGKPVLEKWVLHGAGHEWSGGSSDGSFASDSGPDASREMVRFFMPNARRR